jgi:hypothetical protein
MANNDKSKIRYDDFVGKVQADPANPQSTIMLTGFVGKGGDGTVRIYPDPTLGNWYDVPEADIVHSQPIADSQLGGSYVWIKSSSQVKPGGAGAGAAAAQAQPMAGPPQPGPQPTPTVQTHCFICPPITQEPACGFTPPAVCTHAACPPTPLTQCFICPPHQTPHCSVPAVCSLHCPSSPIVCDTRPSIVAFCHTQQIGLCPPFPTQLALCGTLPQTLPCGTLQQLPGVQQAQPQAFAGGAGAPAPQPFSLHICPTPSAVQQCGPQPTLICTHPAACMHSIVHTQCICPTPTVTNHHVFCPIHTVQINCLQTGNTPCFPITLGGCTPQSIACTPNFTPNGVFNPFGR